MFPARLRDFLAEIYRRDEAWRIADDAGLQKRFIDFSTIGIVCWHSLIEESLRQLRFEQLLAVIKKDHSARTAEIDELASDVQEALPVSPEGDAHRLLAASSSLLSWPQVLPTGDWIERPEEDVLVARLSGSPRACICLLGPPGSGKSALLARVGAKLAASGTVMLALKADQLPRDVRTVEDLERALNLPSPLLSHISALAREKRVLILFDQIDALCDLIDLHTSRLDVLLQLIRSLSAIENVQLVISCRSFEFRHDVRLRTIDTEELHLAIPSWESVEAVLTKRGLSPTAWPLVFKELLRTPQHLAVFLRHLAGTSPSDFASYQSLLEEVWRREVLDTARAPGRAALLAELAVTMSTDETLWVPASRLDSHHRELQQLEAAGILQRSPNGLQIGFAHQSLFEFALARTFSQPGRLSEYVLAKQGALFVRPSLWSGLTYLRVADPGLYLAEVAKLWAAPNLRDHVRYLLIDFMSQHPAPLDQEKQWLFDGLKDARIQHRVLIALAGNAGWFDLLSKSVLPQLMDGPLPVAWKVTPMLSAGWAFARDRVLSLIEQHWLPRSDVHQAAWAVLSQLPHWDARALEDTKTLATATPPLDIMGMLSLIAASAPALAIDLFASVLTRRLAETEAAISPWPARPESGDEAKLMAWHLDDAHHRPFEKLLAADSWYGLDELASSSPSEFLLKAWPPFVAILQRLVADSYPRTDRYRDSYSWALGSDRIHHPAADLPAAIESALTELAEHLPQQFLDLVRDWKAGDVLAMHRLLARGLAKLPDSYANNAVLYLLEDQRRLDLGDSHSPRDSIQLIKRTSPHISDEYIAKLIQAIGAYSLSADGDPQQRGKHARYRLRWERITRLHLYRAISPNRTPDSLKKLISEEERALAPFIDPEEDREIVARVVASPMSSQQMENATDDAVIRLFAELPDSTEWSHPRKSLVGGSIEASRELASLALRQPSRVISLLARFDPTTHQRPVAYAVEKLADSEVPSQFFELVQELDASGFDSYEFRSHIARGLRSVAQRAHGLPDQICDLLKQWLQGVDVSVPPDPEGTETNGGEANRPILWGMNGFVTIPEGTYPFIETLLLGYLCREPPDEKHALELLQEHLTRPESPRVWQLLSHYFRFLAGQSPEVLLGFLDRVFATVPEVLNSPFGARVLAETRGIASPEQGRRWLSSLRAGTWRSGPQAFGELSFLYSTRSDDAWFRSEVTKLFSGESEGAGPSAKRLGAIYSASRLWTHPRYRPLATDVLVAALRDHVATKEVAESVIHALHLDDVPLDDSTDRVLAAIPGAHGLFKATNLFLLIERLSELVSTHPAVVFDICMAMLDEVTAGTSDAVGLGSSMGDLVDIALTLQRIGATRTKGLTLFERLLTLNVYGVDSVLPEIDHRSGRRTAPLRRTRLQRRRDRPK